MTTGIIYYSHHPGARNIYTFVNVFIENYLSEYSGKILIRNHIAPEVKLSSKALIYKSALEGDHFAFDSHTLIRIMVSSRKDNKNYFLEHWKDIKKLISHPVLGKYATLLADAYPLVVSNKILVVEFQLSTMVEKCNLVANQAMLQNVIETALNKRLFIYGVSRKDSVDLQRDYRNLYEVSKLPKASDDDFNLEEEEIK